MAATRKCSSLAIRSLILVTICQYLVMLRCSPMVRLSSTRQPDAGPMVESSPILLVSPTLSIHKFKITPFSLGYISESMSNIYILHILNAYLGIL